MTHFHKGTRSEGLDTFVQTYPKYRWVERDGVVNVEPVKRLGPDLLSRKLDKISIHQVSSLKAFQIAIKQAGLHITNGFDGSQPHWYGLVDIELENVTLRDAMNAIAKSDGQVIWKFGPANSQKSGVCFSAQAWGQKSVSRVFIPF